MLVDGLRLPVDLFLRNGCILRDDGDDEVEGGRGEITTVSADPPSYFSPEVTL